MFVPYLVGGYVRDFFMGVPSKDLDFSVESESYTAMRAQLVEWGFEIFKEDEEYLTIRARVPKGENPLGMFVPGGLPLNLTADFVLCRKESHYTDARHPDSVTVGTIDDDLARRDFTVNAMALRADGTLYDPHNGRADLNAGMLRCVGKPMDRLREDPLRAIRAIRFVITKDLDTDYALTSALAYPPMAAMLASVSQERIREELRRAFAFDTIATILVLQKLPHITTALFDTGTLWLKPTLEAR